MNKNFNYVTHEAGEVDACYESILPANAAFQAVHNKQISTSDRTQLPSLPDPNRGQASLTKPPSRSQQHRHRKQQRRQRSQEFLVIIPMSDGVTVGLLTASELTMLLGFGGKA